MLPMSAILTQTDLRWQVPKRFDALTRNDLNQVIVKSKETKELQTVILDFGNCDYIDSTGLGMLIVLRSDLMNSKIQIKFINLRETVKQIMKIANFDKLFTIFW